MLRVLERYAEQGEHPILLIDNDATSRRATIIYANPAFERVSGYRARELVGRSPLRCALRHLDRDALCAIRAAFKTVSPVSFEVLTPRKNGSPIRVCVSLSPIFDENGKCTNWGACIRDVTEHHASIETAERAAQALRYLAFHDVLTGLPNRSLLLQQVASALLEGRLGSMLSIRLDRFDAIATALGHECADELVAQISHRLRDTKPVDSALARLVAGTFAVWLPGVRDHAQTHDIVLAMLESFAEPFNIDGERVALRAHVGIATTTDTYATPEELLRDAEIAADAAAKANARYRRFTPPLHEYSLTCLRVEFELHRAIARRQFICHFQPIVQMSDGRPGGLEALVRWRDPERGLIPPSLFIPIAEETGHIARIGEQVLEIAAREAVQWPHVDGREIVVNVNVSRRQLDDEHFAQKVFNVLGDTGLSPNRLCLEITETALAKSEHDFVPMLQTLRDAGVRLALDDFGVGYSSLGSLRRLPFTSVKIDRSFIDAGTGNEDSGIADDSIVRMIVALAQTRHLKCTAEGIETRVQWDQARELGCTHAQGFLIAQPMAAEDVRAWLADWAGMNCA